MNHDHLPDLAINPDDICPFLQTIIRAGGGRTAYCYVGGIGNVPCLVSNTLYPMLLWLHWDRETRQFTPAHLTHDNTRSVIYLSDMVLHLPELAKAYQKALNHPVNRKAA